jgi:hypothetical protein
MACRGSQLQPEKMADLVAYLYSVDLVTFLESRSQSKNLARTMDVFAYAVPKGGSVANKPPRRLAVLWR